MRYLFLILSIIVVGCAMKTTSQASQLTAKMSHVELVTVSPQDAGIPVVASARSLVPDQKCLAPFPSWEVHFSPKGGCLPMIVRLISEAKKSVYLQAYGFTAEEIQDALIQLPKRDVETVLVLDRSNKFTDPKLKSMVAAGVKIYIDSKHAIAHNKVIVVDGEIVELGSYNYTASAEIRNAENCLMLRDMELATIYKKNLFDHRGHSVELK